MWGTLYTYALTYIVLPICLVLLCLYGIRLKSFQWKRVTAFVVPLGILAFPLILVQIVNMFDLATFQIGPFSIVNLPSYRSDEIGSMNFFSNIKDVLRYTLFYDDRTYNSTALFGNLYYISVPFVAIGFAASVRDTVVSVKKRAFHYSVPVLAWLIGQLIAGMLLTAPATPNNTRMIGIFGCLLYLLVTGLTETADFLKRVPKIRYGFIVMIGIIYTVCFVFFVKYYFKDYNESAYPFNWLFYEDYEDVGEFLKEHEGEAFTKRATSYPWNYIYYLLEFEIDPYEFNLPENGKERYLQHDINEYMDYIDYNYNYVVYKKDQSSQVVLESMGYEKYDLENFIYYVTPLEKFEEKEYGQGLFELEFLACGNDYVQVSGWAADAENEQPFKSIVIELDGEEYEAALYGREDVATQLGNSVYLESGFLFMLPTDTFTSQKVKIYGITQYDEKIIVYSWISKTF